MWLPRDSAAVIPDPVFLCQLLDLPAIEESCRAQIGKGGSPKWKILWTGNNLKKCLLCSLPVLSNFCTFFFFLVQLDSFYYSFYSVVLIFAIQQHRSARIMHTCPPFLASLPSCHPVPPSHHRAPDSHQLSISCGWRIAQKSGKS